MMAKQTDRNGSIVIDLGAGTTLRRMTITPKMAEELLRNRMGKQRAIRDPHVASLAEEMLNDRWEEFNGQTIVLSEDLKLIDGQHRMSALIKANKTFSFLVLQGVREEAYYTVDSGAKRTGSDTLTAAGYTNTIVLSSALTFFVRYQAVREGNLTAWPTGMRVMNSQIRDLADQYPGIVDAVGKTHGLSFVCGHRGAMAVAYYLFSLKSPDETYDFFDQLRSGDHLEKGDPLRALRNRLIAEKSSRISSADDAFFYLVKGWNLWRKNKKYWADKLGKRSGQAIPFPV